MDQLCPGITLRPESALCLGLQLFFGRRRSYNDTDAVHLL